MTPSEELGTLTRWAADLGRADQDALLLALANTLAQPLGPRTRALFDSLLPGLAEGAAPETLAELTHRLAMAAWAPSALLEALARAGDDALRARLARLPALDEATAATLAQAGSPEVALALASNRRARLNGEALDRLVEASRRSAAMRAPLARRPDLTEAQAARLAGWSSPELRRSLAGRFALPPTPARDEIEGETTRRLVEKLGRTGRLTPDYALSALRRGRLGVFEQAMAVLGGVPPEAVRGAAEADDPARLALACAAVGLDRAAFPEVLREVRAFNNGRPADAPAAAEAVMAALARRPNEAASALRAGHDRRAARWAAG